MFYIFFKFSKSKKKYFVPKKFRYVPTAKCPNGEMSDGEVSQRRIVPTANRPNGETSQRRNVPTAK